MTYFLKAAAAAACLVGIAGCGDAPPTPWEEATEAVRAAVNSGARPAVVIAYLEKGEISYYGYGTEGPGDPDEVDEDTLFAVGSIAKVMTGHLAADMIASGRIAPSLPLDGKGDMQLRHLLTHRTDLPRDIPQAILSAGRPADLAELAETATPTPEPGYSSSGMALAGHLLSEKEGLPFAELARKAVFEPLGMKSTGYAVTDGGRLAAPHRDDRPIENRPETPVLAYPAGGLYSTAADLSRFLGHYAEADFSEAGAAAIAARGWEGVPYGWKSRRTANGTILYHGGDGLGYQAFIAVDPEKDTGVVLLTNSSADDALQQIAIHLLDNETPLPDFGPADKPDLSRFSGFTGRYELEEDADGNIIMLTFDENGAHYREQGPEGNLVRETALEQTDDRTFRIPGIPVLIFLPGSETERLAMQIEEDRYDLIRTGER